MTKDVKAAGKNPVMYGRGHVASGRSAKITLSEGLVMFAGRKLPLTLAFVVVVTLAIGVSCKGFFVDPQLTSIAVGPSGQNVQEGSTLQMSAQGTFSDGSTQNITGSVLWTTSDNTLATISSGGLLTGGNKSGTATVYANKGTISGNTTVNIVLNGVTAITVSPKGPTGVVQGGTQPFTCTATVSGSSQPVDITASVSWTTSDTTNTSITNGANPAVFTANNAAPLNENVTVTASYTVGTTTFKDTGAVTIQ